MESGHLSDPFFHFEYNTLDDFAQAILWFYGYRLDRTQTPRSIEYVIAAVHAASGSVTPPSLWPQEPLKIGLEEEEWRVVLPIIHCNDNRSMLFLYLGSLYELCFY